MAKYIGPKCRLSRREGTDLLSKSGVRPIESKCKLTTPPGQHGGKKSRLGDYAVRLREKQKIKRYYGVSEKQFRNYYIKASQQKGSTGDNLIKLLERRFDNVVYRMGFASTRAEARQLVSHKSLLINDNIVNIASYSVAQGDIISVRQKAREQTRIKGALAISENRTQCDWISVDSEQFKGTFIRFPVKEDLPTLYNVNLVIELYSK